MVVSPPTEGGAEGAAERSGVESPGNLDQAAASSMRALAMKSVCLCNMCRKPPVTPTQLLLTGASSFSNRCKALRSSAAGSWRAHLRRKSSNGSFGSNSPTSSTGDGPCPVPLSAPSPAAAAAAEGLVMAFWLMPHFPDTELMASRLLNSSSDSSSMGSVVSTAPDMLADDSLREDIMRRIGGAACWSKRVAARPRMAALRAGA